MFRSRLVVVWCIVSMLMDVAIAYVFFHRPDAAVVATPLTVSGSLNATGGFS